MIEVFILVLNSIVMILFTGFVGWKVSLRLKHTRDRASGAKTTRSVHTVPIPTALPWWKQVCRRIRRPERRELR